MMVDSNKSDQELQREVLAELDREVSINAADIGVMVQGGVVMLVGFVPSYLQKKTAESITKRVPGVKAVADELEVRLADSHRRTDADIARDAIDALIEDEAVPHERIQLTVEAGYLTLEGTVDSDDQRMAAEKALRHIVGIKRITNRIILRAGSQVAAEEIKALIEQALERSATIDAARITVETRGSMVILSGQVRSYAEREDAAWAASSAPGVTKVENHIVVTS